MAFNLRNDPDKTPSCSSDDRLFLDRSSTTTVAKIITYATAGNAPERRQRQGEGQEQRQRSSWLRISRWRCTVGRTTKKFGTSQAIPSPHMTCVSLHFNVGIFVLSPVEYRYCYSIDAKQWKLDIQNTGMILQVHSSRPLLGFHPNMLMRFYSSQTIFRDPHRKGVSPFVKFVCYNKAKRCDFVITVV
jgi:hypothetical protein